MPLDGTGGQAACGTPRNGTRPSQNKFARRSNLRKLVVPSQSSWNAGRNSQGPTSTSTFHPNVPRAIPCWQPVGACCSRSFRSLSPRFAIIPILRPVDSKTGNPPTPTPPPCRQRGGGINCNCTRDSDAQGIGGRRKSLCAQSRRGSNVPRNFDCLCAFAALRANQSVATMHT